MRFTVILVIVDAIPKPLLTMGIFGLWGKTRTKIPDGAVSQVGSFPHTMAM